MLFLTLLTSCHYDILTCHSNTCVRGYYYPPYIQTYNNSSSCTMGNRSLYKHKIEKYWHCFDTVMLSAKWKHIWQENEVHFRYYWYYYKSKVCYVYRFMKELLASVLLLPSMIWRVTPNLRFIRQELRSPPKLMFEVTSHVLRLY
jgi:hypothetical protein